jgi:hypothetical protein
MKHQISDDRSFGDKSRLLDDFADILSLRQAYEWKAGASQAAFGKGLRRYRM